jgi:hypothetical protein
MRNVVALVVIAASALVGSHGEAQSRRGIPSRVRDALVGCWDLGAGETYVIERSGEHGLASHWAAIGESGASERYASSMFYVSEAEVVQGGCGARTQHGQSCLFEVAADGVWVTLISSYSGERSRRTIQHCAAGTREPTAPTPEVHAVPADAAPRALLTRWRRDIDATLTPTGADGAWTLYGDALAITFDHGVAMRVRMRTSATTCEDAARAAGFEDRAGSAPLHRADGCDWPGISERHRLAPHVAGRFVGGVMEIWRTE